jgi:hypothetical protein
MNIFKKTSTKKIARHIQRVRKVAKRSKNGGLSPAGEQIREYDPIFLSLLQTKRNYFIMTCRDPLFICLSLLQQV